MASRTAARAVRFAAALALMPPAAPAHAALVLFDASHHEMAGNADWVVDADAWNQTLPAFPCSGSTNESAPSRFPTPAQSGITPSTPETYFTGGISAWAVDLVKAGHTIETLPPGAAITFGDGGNPQDLSNYKLFVVVEPQTPFTAPEKAAILAFVSAGGGLFMVGDHETSDRDCDGWDSPHVWNDLTGAVSAASAGVFGIWFRVDGLSNQGSEDWFDDAVDSNVETNPADPIIQGPFGAGTGGLGFFGATSMELNNADNPTVTAHVWRTGQAHGTTRVTFATASYGSGRVAAIGDSSPADDDTGDPSDSLYPGWDKASGGVKNREIHLNACHWLINPAPDVTPPVIVTGPGAAASDCSAQITWGTDEPATSSVDYGPTASYGSTAGAVGLTQAHTVAITGLTPSSPCHYRVSSSDAAGNGPAQSADAAFATAAPAPPSITAGPAAASIGSTSATLTWSTDEPSTSEVQYGTTMAYGQQESAPGLTTAHAVTLTGLAPATLYHARALSTDGCGNGPVLSGDLTFTTGAPAVDLSGWKINQFNSSQTWTIPAGTMLPAGGYLVIGRNASRAQFQAFYPAMPGGTVYLDSNANGSCSSAGCMPQINGGESFELRDAGGALRDGPTIAMATTHLTYQRTSPGAPPGNPGSWTTSPETAATPGSGAGAPSGSGLRINEMSDASDFTKEFLEIYSDAGALPPDVTPPAPVTNLTATPVSSTGIVLSWTASGDDGSNGTASLYDARISASPITTPAEFAAATPLTGEPAPAASGTPQQFPVNGLSADTAYSFAMTVRDEAPNVSPLSNPASAVTAPAGGPPPVSHLVISQIRVAGSADDVIEIYNPTAAAIPLSGHSVQYLAANGNFGFRANLNGSASVPAHGWYLVAANSYGGSPARDDSIGSSNMSNGAGHALLVSKTTNVSGCSDPAIVDRAGYGLTATCPEGGSGHATTTPGASQSVTRKPGGVQGNGQDTDDNAADFSAPAAPVFHNAASAPATPPTVLGNVKNTLYMTAGASGATLVWATAAGATGYHIYRGTAPNFMSGAPAPWMTAPSTTAVDGALPAPIYFYVVLATDGTSDSAE